jgi:tRNA (guanosine-2'-O-)-methyltransferase
MTQERQQKMAQVLAHRQNNLTVVLENIEDPRNITAVMRSCESVGIQDVYLINSNQPRTRVYNYKSGRSAAKWLTIHEFDSVTACYEQLRKHYQKILTTHLSANAVSVYDVDFTESIALVFGAETTGVTNEAQQLADGNFIIPQVGFVQSLNISVACAVSLYEAYRQKKAAGHYNQPSLPTTQINALTEFWTARDLNNHF